MYCDQYKLIYNTIEKIVRIIYDNEKDITNMVDPTHKKDHGLLLVIINNLNYITPNTDQITHKIAF